MTDGLDSQIYSLNGQIDCLDDHTNDLDIKTNHNNTICLDCWTQPEKLGRQFRKLTKLSRYSDKLYR